MFAKKSRKRRVGRRLGFERLETREVLAGNVLATFNPTNGLLTLTGDASDNDLVIARVGTGAVLVQGGNLNGQTTVNGSISTYSPPGVVQQVVIDFAAGNDNVEITNLTPITPTLVNPFPPFSSGPQPGIQSALQASTQVNLGTTLTINMGAGNDNAIINALVTGTISVDGQAGLDTISLQGTTADRIVVQDTADTSATNVALYNVLVNSVSINTGAGADRVDIRGGGAATDIRNSLNILTGLGNDTIRLGSLAAGEPQLNLRANTNIDTADGLGVVFLENMTNQGRIDVSTGVNMDTVTINQVTLDNLSIRTLNGNDVLNITLSVFTDLNVNMGDGDDVVTIASTSFDNSIIDGSIPNVPLPVGTVGDRITYNTGNTTFKRTTVRNFELGTINPTTGTINFGQSQATGTIRLAVAGNAIYPPKPVAPRLAPTVAGSQRPNTVPARPKK